MADARWYAARRSPTFKQAALPQLGGPKAKKKKREAATTLKGTQCLSRRLRKAVGLLQDEEGGQRCERVSANQAGCFAREFSEWLLVVSKGGSVCGYEEAVTMVHMRDGEVPRKGGEAL